MTRRERNVERMDPVRELKVRAEILQTKLEAKDSASFARLRALTELRHADDVSVIAKAAGFRRKHCLAVVARECGFASWEQARVVLGGGAGDGDFGTLLYGNGVDASAIMNRWFAHYEEARDALKDLPDEPRHYLLAYKRHCVIVEGPFVAALGLDPDDPDWRAIGWDWVRPLDPVARRRLYGRRLRETRGDR
jgi:hypothetical protein